MNLREIKTKSYHYFVDEQDRIQGERKWFFENGNIQSIAYYKDGKAEGESKWFFENGNIREIAYFKDNKREGELKCFYENGNIEEISYWKNGEDITKKVLAKRELLEAIEKL